LGIALATGFMCLTALLFWLAPRFVIGLYVDVADPINAELIAYAVGFLAVAAMFQLVDGMQVAAAGALRGLKDTRVPMLLTLVAYWLVGLTSGVGLAYGLGVGPRGLWFGMVAGLAVAALLLTTRFSRSTRRGALAARPTSAIGD
jgi:MATE family multidrug resistance protein